jgi:hypothetical protein
MASPPTPQNSLLGLLVAPRNAIGAEDAVLTDPRCLRSSKEFLRLCENRSTLRDGSDGGLTSPEAGSASIRRAAWKALAAAEGELTARSVGGLVSQTSRSAG